MSTANSQPKTEDPTGCIYPFPINSHSIVAGRKRLQKNTSGVANPGWIEEERNNLRAYEYLCHVGEAKEYFTILILFMD